MQQKKIILRRKKDSISNLEVRDAQLDLTQAETNYAQALYDYNLAIALIERAIGMEAK